MLNASPQVMRCYERALAARARALETDDPLDRNDFFAFERNWLNLAQSYEFSERLTKFLQRARPFPAHPVFGRCGVPTPSKGVETRLVRHPLRTGNQTWESERWRIAIGLVQRLREAGIECHLSDGSQTRH